MLTKAESFRSSKSLTIVHFDSVDKMQLRWIGMFVRLWKCGILIIILVEFLYLFVHKVYFPLARKEENKVDVLAGYRTLKIKHTGRFREQFFKVAKQSYTSTTCLWEQ